jgi:hypothetical protein
MQISVKVIVLTSLWANAIDVEQVVLTRNDTPHKNGLASLQGHDFTPYSGFTAWA